MNTLTAWIRTNTLRNPLRIAFAIGALAMMSAGAHAAEPDQVTLEGPVVKTTGRDLDTGAPVERVTVTAIIEADAVSLTTASGVVLLNDNVREAARKVCAAADPLNPEDDRCVRDAIQSAKPQIAAAIAHARSEVNG